jgi:hypothetical protein
MIETKVVTTYNNFTLFYDNGKSIDCSGFVSCCRELGEDGWWFAGFDLVNKQMLVFQRELPKDNSESLACE